MKSIDIKRTDCIRREELNHECRLQKELAELGIRYEISKPSLFGMKTKKKNK